MILYNIIMYLIQPLIWIRLLWKSKYNLEYLKKWKERYGFNQKNHKIGGIILHAASVGETLTIIPLIYLLKKKYPETYLTITYMTPTGMKLAKSILGKKVQHYSYLPYDLPGSINRFLKTTKPKLIITVETEIWPNLITISHQKKIPFIIINARLSKKSYIKYNKIHKFINPIIKLITLIVTQNKEDKSRFLKLGAKNSQLRIIGNLKFDVTITKTTKIKSKTLREKWKINRPIWIAGSTHPGEDKYLLKAHNILLKKFPNLLMIITPRHPERSIKIQKIAKKIKLEYIKYSSGIIPLKTTKLIINDTIGHLKILYGIADIAFIGGSLIKNGGGHNPLEAAVYAIPILIGPYTFNFQEIYRQLKHEKGVIIIKNIVTLVQEISNLLMNKNYRNNKGNNALKILYKNKGNTKKLLNILQPYLQNNN